jgi:hypothetical protein
MLNLIPLGPGEFSWRDKFQTAEYINQRLEALRSAYTKDPEAARKVLSYTLPGLRGRELTDMEIRTRLGLSEGEKIAASLRFFNELDRLSAPRMPLYRVKTAGVPRELMDAALDSLHRHRALTGMGAGIGAGSEAVRSFMADPADNSFGDHLVAGAKGALRGGAIGAVSGYGASQGLSRLSPETFASLTTPVLKRPVAIIDGLDTALEYVKPGLPGLAAEAIAKTHLTPKGQLELMGGLYTDIAPAINSLQAAWMHPATRAGMGALSAAQAQYAYQDWKEKHRLRSLVSGPTPSETDKKEMEAIKVRRGMGAYAEGRHT